MFSKLTTATSRNGGQYSSRNGARVDRIILHHCASTSLVGVLGMMSSGSREVSANYVIGNRGEIVGVVPEEHRAWTSGSASWDGRAVTFEIVNETGAPEWRISAQAFEAVARMLADLSGRYKIPLSRETVITHQELYSRYGASYATACPGPYFQARIDQLIVRAKAILAGASDTKPTQIRRNTTMFGMRINDGKGRYGKAGAWLYATFDSASKTITYLTEADANQTSVNLGKFANLTYAGWEGYHVQADTFIDATVDPPARLVGANKK